MRSRIIFFSLILMAILYSSCSSQLEVSRGPVDPQSFEFADRQSNGWVRGRADSLWGFYHPGGGRLIKPQLPWVANFSDGYALLQRDSQYYFLNEKGRIPRKNGYDWAYGYTEGKAAVQHSNGQFGYLDARR